MSNSSKQRRWEWVIVRVGVLQAATITLVTEALLLLLLLLAMVVVVVLHRSAQLWSCMNAMMTALRTAVSGAGWHWQQETAAVSEAAIVASALPRPWRFKSCRSSISQA
jgi:uncharacterized protein (DUF58 family)